MGKDGSEIVAPNGADSGKLDNRPDISDSSTQEWAKQLTPAQTPSHALVTRSKETPKRREPFFPGPSTAPNLALSRPEPTSQMKQADEIFCSSCGRAIKRQAVICVHCGVPVQGGALAALPRPKSKTVVTIGMWALFVAWPWAIIDAAVKPSEYYEQFPNYS